MVRAAMTLLLLLILWSASAANNTVVAEFKDGMLYYNGSAYVLETSIEPEHAAYGSPEFYLYIGISLGLVLFAGAMSGLTVGFCSIDPLKLELLRSDESSDDFNNARKLAPILSQQHYLLCTLLLANALAMEALPIFLDKVMPSVVAVIVSVTMVLVFGEILPQALCMNDALAIGARFAWLVKGLMAVFFPISWPLGKLLDCVLGATHSRNILFKRSELETLVDLHITPSLLHSDEASMMKGALLLRHKTALQACTPLHQVYMVERNAILDEDTMSDIMASGYSRVPVYVGTRSNVIGVLIVKHLIIVDPEENRPVSQFGLRAPIVVDPSTSLYDLLNLFQKGKSHLALVSRQVELYNTTLLTDESNIPQGLDLLGVITIEDVLEDLIAEEIYDESDRRERSRTAATQKGVQRAVAKFKGLLKSNRPAAGDEYAALLDHQYTV